VKGLFWMMVSGVMLLHPVSSDAGSLNVDGAVLDESGTTLVTACRNTQGYYVERGVPLDVGELTARGFTDGAPVLRALTALAPDGWRVLVGKGVSRHQRVSWRGGRTWPATLAQLAHDYNFVVILDWDRREVFVDRL